MTYKNITWKVKASIFFGLIFFSIISSAQNDVKVLPSYVFVGSEMVVHANQRLWRKACEKGYKRLLKAGKQKRWRKVFIKTKRAYCTQFDYTLRASVHNSWDATIYNLKGVVTASGSGVEVIKGIVDFGTVEAGQSKTPDDVFRIRINAMLTPDSAPLTWQLAYDRTSEPSPSPESKSAPSEVGLHVDASDPYNQTLHYKWVVSEGFIRDEDSPNTTYVMPSGPGVHFVNVLVYNSHGGYTERRIALVSDGVGTPLSTNLSRPDFTPPTEAATGHSDEAYLIAWSGAGRYVYVPDASLDSNDLATRLLKTNVHGQFLQTSPLFTDLFGEDIYHSFRVSLATSELVSIFYSNSLLGPLYNVEDLSAPRVFGVSGGFIFGSAHLADGTTCGTDNPFFGISTSGTAIGVDNSGKGITAPVKVNSRGDYALPYDRAITGVRLSCESATPVTVAVFSAVTSDSGIAAPAVFSDSAKPVIAEDPPGMQAFLQGKSVGKFLSPHLSQPSDKIEGGDHFLSYKGIDTKQSACAYYLAIGAVKACDKNGEVLGAITFDDWKKKSGMAPYSDPGVPEFTATYINKVDLNLTRRHHSIAYPASLQNSTGSVAAYVCNHLGPATSAQSDIDEAIANAVAGRNLVACVAMDYGVAGPYVRFFGFAANGQLLTSINLDGRREKYVPGTCTVCHGGDRIRGRFDENNSGSPDIGAHFLPYDIGNFAFSSEVGLRQDDQEENIYNLNQNVLKADPTSNETNLITSWYHNGHTQDIHYVPQEWLDEANPATARFKEQRLGTEVTKLYSEVNARYCRTCHIAIVANGNQDTEDPRLWFDGSGRLDIDIDEVVCGGYPAVHRNHSMPNSLVTFNLFWSDPAARELLEQVKGGPCRDDPKSGASADPGLSLPAVTALIAGAPISISGGGGSLMYFEMDVPLGVSALTINTSGGSGEVSIEVFKGKPNRLYDPERFGDNYFSCFDEGKIGTLKKCSVDTATSGTGIYYVLINGLTAYDKVKLEATLD